VDPSAPRYPCAQVLRAQISESSQIVHSPPQTALLEPSTQPQGGLQDVAPEQERFWEEGRLGAMSHASPKKHPAVTLPSQCRGSVREAQRSQTKGSSSMAAGRPVASNRKSQRARGSRLPTNSACPQRSCHGTWREPSKPEPGLCMYGDERAVAQRWLYKGAVLQSGICVLQIVSLRM